jgi:hypothetical protein
LIAFEVSETCIVDLEGAMATGDSQHIAFHRNFSGIQKEFLSVLVPPGHFLRKWHDSWLRFLGFRKNVDFLLPIVRLKATQ